MKLLSLKLLNYRRFRQEEIIFGDDFSLIFGKNGAGKSSVLDAIGYALFGPSSADFIRVKTDLLRSHFVREREPSKVELTFQYGMQTYRVVRVIDAGVKKFASDFIIENKDTLIGENLEILGGSEVSNEIVKIIGVDRNTFLRSVFAQQKDLEVLSGTKEERKKLIHSILGLDVLENLIFDIKHQQKEKKTAFEYLKSKVQNFDIESLDKNISDMQKIIEEQQKELSPLLKEKTFKQTAFEALKKDFGILQEQKDLYFTLQHTFVSQQNTFENSKKSIGEYQNHLQNIASKEEQIQKFVGIPEQEQKQQKILENFALQKEQFIQKQKYLNEQKSLISEQENINLAYKKLLEKNIETTLEDITIEIQNQEKNILEITKNVSTLESELQQITKEAGELKAEMSHITELGSESSCPTCKRPLQEHYPKLMQLFETSLQEKRELYKLKNEQKSHFQVSLETSKKLLSEQKQQEKNLQQEKNSFIQTQTKLQNISQNLENISEKIAQFGTQEYNENLHIEAIEIHNVLKKDIQIYLELAGEIKNKPLFEEKLKTLSEDVKKLELHMKETQESLKNIKFDEKKYLEKKAEYENYYQVLEQLSSQISVLQNQIKDQEFALLTLQNQKKQFETEQQEQQKLMEEVDYLEHKKNVFTQYISHLLQYLKPNIEALTSEYFSKITDGKYSEVTLDENYNIEIDGKTIDLYSGGERDLANLCFRLSLGQNLSQRRGNPINFLVLDEVLGSQDKERQQNILINLKKLENKFSQILLISHVDEIKEFATNLIEVQSINREESRVVSY